MWKFKKCPRCGGDLWLDKDEYSWYEECLQCGYERDMKNVAEFMEEPSEQERANSGVGRARRT